MIAYYDTSALVPLVLPEQASAQVARLWDGADKVVSVLLAYTEARAALALAHRLGRLDRAALRRAVRQFDVRYARLHRMAVDEGLVRRAGEVAQAASLRGYDAVHLAAAERLADDDVVFVSGDRALCQAGRAMGLQVSEL